MDTQFTVIDTMQYSLTYYFSDFPALYFKQLQKINNESSDSIAEHSFHYAVTQSGFSRISKKASNSIVVLLSRDFESFNHLQVFSALFINARHENIITA